MNYVMFLRGINVGGIKVPMAGLRESLAGLDLDDVKTYLQTGNVSFTSNQSIAKLKPAVEAILSQQFGYKAFVLIYPASVLADVIGHYPFATDQWTHRYAIFCADNNVIDELMANRIRLDTDLEDIARGPHVVYWRVPIGSTVDTPFSKIIAQPKYKAVTTNRNLNTLEKMVY